jgi:hypothetical protein
MLNGSTGTGADQRWDGTTWKASPAWTYSTIRARHVGLEVRLLAGGARRAARKRAGQALADLADGLDGTRVRRLHPAVLLHVGVGEHRHLVAQVVEREDHVGEHQRHVRQPHRIRVGLGEALDRAHAVVAEEADRAARERREPW